MKLAVVPSSFGLVVYQGPSLFDGEPIVAIATGLGRERSENVKTGKMVQVWILNKYSNPLEASELGEDISICGECKHRHFRSCYVNLAHGPYQVWKHWKEGIYPNANMQSLKYFAGRKVRLGAYGDPAAVPCQIWDSICNIAKGHTAYTHSWKRASASPHKKYCMASCDTLKEVRKAISKGWKPFYVRSKGEIAPDGFFECPASHLSGKRLTCSQCLACDGGEYKGQGIPTLEIHGPSWKVVKFNAGMNAMKNKKCYTSVGWNNIY